jgi:hypothetical protein
VLVDSWVLRRTSGSSFDSFVFSKWDALKLDPFPLTENVRNLRADFGRAGFFITVKPLHPIPVPMVPNNLRPVSDKFRVPDSEPSIPTHRCKYLPNTGEEIAKFSISSIFYIFKKLNKYLNHNSKSSGRQFFK